MVREKTDALSARDFSRAAALSRKSLLECLPYLSEDDWVSEITGLALALNMMGQYAETLATTDRCLARLPRAIECWLDKGQALDHLGRPREAREAFQSVMRFRPRNEHEIKMQRLASGRMKEIDEALSAKEDVPLGVQKRGAVLSIKGPITGQTQKDFITAITGWQQAPMVSLDSQGGSVGAAMAIGEILRNRAFGTIVGTYDECSSACVLILAAGVQRTADTGKIGIHRPTFDDQSGFGSLSQQQATAEYNKLTDDVRSYLRRMGMADGLFLAMLRVPSGQVRYLTPDEIRSFGLEGEDPAWAEWLKAHLIAKEGRANYEINQSFFAILNACINSGIDGKQCDQDIRSKFETDVDDCAKTTARDPISCAREIRDRMISAYTRRP